MSKLFVFGDSLSDGGNSGVLTGGAFTPPPYVQNRYSNGPVAVEQLWQLFNPGDLSFQPSLAGGTNYAIGGSTSGQENDVGLYIPTFAGLGMASQLDAHAAAGPLFDPSTTLLRFCFSERRLLFSQHRHQCRDLHRRCWHSDDIG
ncbi:MAG: hypothetical protein FJ083_13845 [Cyanobacteria bacterium K_Offshore_surface_m2_239]|nr:hypothetical protein [Cyanobacteria bacterium K_Offshore_surface_m2_239]